MNSILLAHLERLEHSSYYSSKELIESIDVIYEKGLPTSDWMRFMKALQALRWEIRSDNPNSANYADKVAREIHKKHDEDRKCEQFDVFVRLVDIDGTMAVVISGISIEVLETNQEVYDQVKQMIKDLMTREV